MEVVTLDLREKGTLCDEKLSRMARGCRSWLASSQRPLAWPWCISSPLYRTASLHLPASTPAQGAKTAAVRKLRHELGIEGLPVHSFKYLTRLHYCAADTRTYGPQAEWGEHEMDYILFARADVGVHPNPEEVQVRVWEGGIECSTHFYERYPTVAVLHGHSCVKVSYRAGSTMHFREPAALAICHLYMVGHL